MRPCLRQGFSPSSASCVSLRLSISRFSFFWIASLWKMKVSSSITSSSVRTVGSFKKVSNIPARVQSRWVLSLQVSRFSSLCNRFSLCLAAVSLRSATYCLCLSFSNSSLMGNFSFLIMGKTKATNFLRLIAFGLGIIKLFCYESVKALRPDFPVCLRHILHCFYEHISCIYHILCQTPIIRNRN